MASSARKRPFAVEKRYAGVLFFIYQYNTKHPWCPDYREIAEALKADGKKPLSTSVVSYYVNKLFDEGYVSALVKKVRPDGTRSISPRTIHLTKKGELFVAEHLVPLQQKTQVKIR